MTMTSAEMRFTDIPFNISEVLRALYFENEPNPVILELIEELLSEIRAVCKPKFCYSIFDSNPVGQNGLTIGGVVFTPGPIIYKALENGEKQYIVIATAGVEFDEWLHRINARGDILITYLADSIGSEIAEATVRMACEKVGREAALNGFQISNSYSPGYCNWHVSEQQKLFSLFPDAPCGVTLNDSSLMSPIKSISTVVAVGRKVERRPYGCEICSLKSCFRKKIQKHN